MGGSSLDIISGGGSASSTQPLIIGEELLVFGLHTHTIFDMTLARFRRVFNKNNVKAGSESSSICRERRT